ncbi:prepilin-type N-terminal cleavage/methylation domain-containing protein [Uruburuella testudinis]|uniref:Prepilin-type N-terminal cleavage/methylation domain-containing protein n=1 Tax=Uruburuella testudinis TaxID=1282863 RepID=A0ABY4DQW3_9NEIS|nr:type IV pilin protein [Uruburuella testudinis]UOO81281.1 prepilin-type N-terminal cleavage/methylation domain-containing protein [Uruburuella testudinis]
MFQPLFRQQGFTLLQLLLAVALLAILATAAWPAYEKHIRRTELQAARTALLENAHFMERFYQQHRSFKQTSTTWPALPVGATDAFCIRPQGLARGALDGKFTLKAVAFNQNREPRTIKINEALTTIICETTTSSCDDDNSYFTGGSTVDKKCTVFR